MMTIVSAKFSEIERVSEMPLASCVCFMCVCVCVRALVFACGCACVQLCCVSADAEQIYFFATVLIAIYFDSNNIYCMWKVSRDQAGD
jgi:hypothetical protein